MVQKHTLYILCIHAEAYRALELLEQYVQQLEGRQGSEDLQEALKKAIVAIRSRLFQALLGEMWCMVTSEPGVHVCFCHLQTYTSFTS